MIFQEPHMLGKDTVEDIHTGLDGPTRHFFAGQYTMIHKHENLASMSPTVKR